MDQVFQIALEYGKGRITQEGIDYAMNLLGLNKQQQNPKYAISLGGKSFDPMGMLKRAGVNKMFSSGSSMGGLGSFGGAALMGGAALGLGYLTNPLREGSRNYNPNLQGQLDYASRRGFIDRNNSAGALRYNKNSVLSGQNAISGFGTNDYGKQLQKYRDKYSDTMPKERLEKLDREIQDQITDDFDKTDKFMETIAPAAPVYTPSPGDNGGGGGGGSNNYGSSGKVDTGGFEQDGTGRQGYGRGGIASL